MKIRKEAPDEVISILGEGTELSGEVSFSKGLRVDGAVIGKIRSEGSLTVGPKGRLDAEVHIRRLSINGEVRGTVYSSERVEIRKDGKVFGDIFTPCLIIEAGAVFEGKCNMNEGKKNEESGEKLRVV